MRTKPSLQAADAEKIMAACKAEAIKNKWNVSIAIVDDAGQLLRFERLDGARPITSEIALGKAKSSAAFHSPTKRFDEMMKDRPSLLTLPAGIPVEGGVPLMYQGECVGAVAASGVQSHEDAQIANAGAATLV